MWTDTIINGVPISTGVNTWSANTVSGTAYIRPSSLEQPPVIKGEMFTAELHENAYAAAHRVVDDNTIKLQLVQDLLEKLMNSNHIEYTKQVNAKDMSFTYRARIFAVPNTDVQTIRTRTK